MEFPLSEKPTRFGRLPDPKIPVILHTLQGLVRVNFLLDTGADFTMLPKHLAAEMGIDLTHCPTDRSVGIEGRGIRVHLSPITVNIGPHQLTLRCLFAEREGIPYILGRADLFDHFSVTFDNRRKRIVLTRL